MTNGWTGGQYSLFRVVLGSYLAVHFAMLLPLAGELLSSQRMPGDDAASPLTLLNVLTVVDAPWAVAAMISLGAVAAVSFAAGFHDRVSALLLCYIGACLFARSPQVSNPGLPLIGWILLAHACLPPAPYGSVAARGRVDPGGGWTFPAPIFAAAWIVMAVAYSYIGLTKLADPSWLGGAALLQLAFAPLALLRRLRPLLWCAMLAMQFGLLMLPGFADVGIGMVMLHLFTFDPAWLAPRAGLRGTLVFYDGHCGLCHGFVRFLLAEDREHLFRLSPLQGDAFARSVAESDRATLPDSVVVRRSDGRLLVRSEAALLVLDALGGVWRVIALFGRLVPRALRDAAYDGVAATRHRLFAQPAEVCPLVPAELRSRFAD